MSDLISIIMPAYKAQPFLERSIRSVLAQTYENWELLLISDDEFDYAPFLVSIGIDDPRIKFWSTGQVGAGPSRGRNIGIKAAAGSYIALLDSDDELMPDKLARALPPLKQYGFVSCALQIESDAGVLGTFADGPDDVVLGSDEFVFKNYSMNSMILWDKSRVPTLYREDLIVLEDHVFVMECFEHVDQIYHFADPLHVYWKVETSLSNDPEKFQMLLDNKDLIIQRLENDGFIFKNSATGEAYLTFFKISKEMEEIFNDGRKINPNIKIEDIYDELFRREGIA